MQSGHQFLIICKLPTVWQQYHFKTLENYDCIRKWLHWKEDKQDNPAHMTYSQNDYTL